MVAGSLWHVLDTSLLVTGGSSESPGHRAEQVQSRVDQQEVPVYESYGCYLRGIERGFKGRLHYGRKASSMHSRTSMVKERPELKGQYHTRAALVWN